MWKNSVRFLFVGNCVQNILSVFFHVYELYTSLEYLSFEELQDYWRKAVEFTPRSQTRSNVVRSQTRSNAVRSQTSSNAVRSQTSSNAKSAFAQTESSVHKRVRTRVLSSHKPRAAFTNAFERNRKNSSCRVRTHLGPFERT